MSFVPDTSNKEFQDALNLVKYTRQSIFLTGKAGTGKSTFLRYVCANIRKKHVVLAPTGIAAINAGGSTLHSFFKLPFYPLLPDDPKLSLQRNQIYDFFKYTKPHRKLLEELELVIIDEISMVRADIIDAVDRILRVYSHNLRQPFGGKQLLLVGDVFQLEPVVKGDERDILNRFYPTPFFFSARVFSQIELVSIELQKVYRQTDSRFIQVLDHIRNNTAAAADLQLLNTRYGAPMTGSEDDMYITLATRRDNVDYINEKKLAELPGEPTVFRGEIRGDFPTSSLPTAEELVLKPGAQVIFIKNDYERRWVNGTIGVVNGFDLAEGTLYIITDDGRECSVKQDSWRNIRYTYNEEKKQIEEEELGTFTQFPVRLAWAITVHKSQGLTFSRAVIDFTGGVFAGGQTYVALSRCTSLEGIQLRKPISRADIFVRPEIVQFSERFNNRQAIERALKEAQADVQYAAAAKAFDKGDISTFLDEFFKAIHNRYDLEKPAVQRLLRRKLNIINTLREENRTLKAAAMEKEKTLIKYAREYITMGDECLKHDMPEAAMRNYEKAVSLCPKFKEAWKKIKKLEKNMLKRK
ncbi:ATP-dependent DNA helicase [Mediterranea massiliensis]|uniref:ATP-dependent DNA helicase n=1 Tax=Mediterranea massiliensis TaxID=1841865 RepID=UPI0025A36D93|nr:AAA family ATPase [Mediterranea massiliensis]MDM8336721.1 AAA family ATPase [Mediterranea massiliensis]